MSLTFTARWLPLLMLGLLSGRAASVAPTMLLLDGTAAGAEVIVVGERGTILRSSDQARTWEAAVVPPTATLTAVSFAPGDRHGWVVGHDAVILASTDSGRTWRKQWQGETLADSFLDVLALDADHVIAVGAYGLFASTADGGQSWHRRKIMDEDFHLNRLTRGPAGQLYLAGEHGTLLRSDDSGATWQHIDSPYDGSFYGILPLDDHTLLAYGLRGRVYRSLDDGGSWALVRNDYRTLIATAVKRADGTLLFVGQSRAWFISRDGGSTLATWPAPFAPAIARLLALPDGSILALGEAGAVVLPQP